MSIPNIAYWDVVRSIMRDDFTYQDSGNIGQNPSTIFYSVQRLLLCFTAGLEVINDHRNADVHRGQLGGEFSLLVTIKCRDVVQLLRYCLRKIA
ncbi:MAG: hypothetical protein IPM69_12015 [Ignavibacteria bacterium]|nr:hypothetical protein [Ignavibacteria bacterium]